MTDQELGRRLVKAGKITEEKLREIEAEQTERKESGQRVATLAEVLIHRKIITGDEYMAIAHSPNPVLSWGCGILLLAGLAATAVSAEEWIQEGYINDGDTCRALWCWDTDTRNVRTDEYVFKDTGKHAFKDRHPYCGDHRSDRWFIHGFAPIIGGFSALCMFFVIGLGGLYFLIGKKS